VTSYLVRSPDERRSLTVRFVPDHDLPGEDTLCSQCGEVLRSGALEMSGELFCSTGCVKSYLWGEQ